MYKLILTTLAKRPNEGVSVSTTVLDFDTENTAENAGKTYVSNLRAVSDLSTDVRATFVVVPGDKHALSEKYGTP